MNVWFIGGGVYAAFLFFALALCRVAGGDDSDDTAHACATKPGPANVEHEQLLGLDGVCIDVAAQGDTDDAPHPGSRPSTGTRPSREPRLVPPRHQQFIER